MTPFRSSQLHEPSRRARFESRPSEEEDVVLLGLVASSWSSLAASEEEVTSGGSWSSSGRERGRGEGVRDNFPMAGEKKRKESRMYYIIRL